MRLARELGISPKRLTGWEPAERVTVIDRDSRGRPSVLQVEREPEWDEEQVALFLALDETEEEYGPHGVLMSEATSALADPSNRHVGWHYDVPNPKIDHAQRALNVEQERRRAAYPDEDAGSLLWTVLRVEDGPLNPEQP